MQRVFQASQFNEQSLEKRFGNKKTLVDDFRLPILVALAQYPELSDTKISFRLAKKESAGKTTFTFLSFFNRRKHFIIYINNDPKNTGILFEDASFNAQVGMIGHELAHVVEFESLGTKATIWWALNYLAKYRRRKIEQEIDRATIKHGLGWQLFSWNSFVLKSSSVNPRYKLIKERYYLLPAQIEKIISNPE